MHKAQRKCYNNFRYLTSRSCDGVPRKEMMVCTVATLAIENRKHMLERFRNSV